MGRALSKLNAAEMNLLKNFNPSTASEVLAPCVTQITHISCVDDSKDFCVGSTIYVGLGVLFAIFLPGIVRALGNLVFYRVSNNTQNNVINSIREGCRKNNRKKYGLFPNQGWGSRRVEKNQTSILGSQKGSKMA